VQVNQTYLNNMKALYHADLRLAQRVDDSAPDPHLQVVPSRTGVPTAKTLSDAGKEIFLHSRYDPLAEAKKFVDGLDLDKNFCFIISGLGLGYHIAELFSRVSDQTAVVVVEPNPSLIKAALQQVDLADPIRTERLIFLQRADKGAIHEKLQPLGTIIMLGTELAQHPSSRQCRVEFHRAIWKHITDYVAYWRMSMVTLIGNCKKTCRNIINNLVSYACCPPIDVLKNRFAGFPAVVVSAGPSLAKNLHLVKQAKGKAAIIAVQTTLKPLKDSGVDPDFVVSLDYHPISRQFFEGVEDFGRIHLVAEPKVTWHVLDAFKGRISLPQNEFADLCLGRAARPRDSIKAGTTVAHLAFYLAEYLGADPIILVGQDLAFSDGHYYAPGTTVHQMWAMELNRFHTVEMKEWERVVRNRGILRKLTDVHGRDVYTDEQMFTYLQQFERDFAGCKSKIIDATEGGLRKQGTEVMAFRQVLDRYCARPLPDNAFEYLDKTQWFDASAVGPIIEQLNQRMDEVNEFREICEQTVDLLKQLQTLVDDPQQFNRVLSRVDELRTVVSARRQVLHMVCCVSALADLRRHQQDHRIGAVKARLEARERAGKQLVRDIQFVESVIEGCDMLKDLLQEGIDRAAARLEQAQQTADTLQEAGQS